MIEAGGTNVFNNRKFVAGLALRRLWLRRVGVLHGSEIQVELGLLFVALVLVLLAKAQDFLQDFHIEALSLGLSEDFLLAFIQRLDLLVDVFNALDKGANAIAGDSCRICHALSLFQRAYGIGMKVTEKLIKESSRVWLDESWMGIRPLRTARPPAAKS